jgi:hypothetical protein
MDKALILGVIPSIVAIAAATIAVWGQLRVKRVEAQLAIQKAEADRRAETEHTARQFREPLGRAAYELQSRIFNIVRGGFLQVYMENGDDRTRLYAIHHTAFVIAQYFGWTELIRREIQFIDLGKDEETRRLAQLQHRIYAAFQTDRFPPLLRVFGGEQHAIGERMIREGPRGPQCIGYAGFLDYLKSDPDPLIRALENDVQALGTQLKQAIPRLIEFQHSLIDLVVFLDPQAVRFPEKNRIKLDS